MMAAPGAGECVAWGHERSRFPLFVDGAKGVVDEVARGCGMDAEVARFLKSRVVGGSDRLARGVRSDERAAACMSDDHAEMFEFAHRRGRVQTASRLAAGRPSR